MRVYCNKEDFLLILCCGGDAITSDRKIDVDVRLVVSDEGKGGKKIV